MSEERELLERAQSIVRKALSAISEDQEAEQVEEEKDEDTGDIGLSLDDISIENDDNPNKTTEEKSIIETGVTLSESVITAVSVEGLTESRSPSDEPDGLNPDQDSGSFISLHSSHSLKIPSAEPLEEEDEEEEEEDVVERREETRAEFVVRKNFENFTEYTKQLNGKDFLSEKRYLQMLRELGLIGPGTSVDTTDAEIVFFKHAKQRTKGLTVDEFKECLQVVLALNKREIESICEEVLYPHVPVHHYRAVFMSVK
ncbi:hypothetical protein ACHWQZ_G011960 [Mnemiopsis leidyi]